MINKHFIYSQQLAQDRQWQNKWPHIFLKCFWIHGTTWPSSYGSLTKDSLSYWTEGKQIWLRAARVMARVSEWVSEWWWYCYYSVTCEGRGGDMDSDNMVLVMVIGFRCWMEDKNFSEIICLIRHPERRERENLEYSSKIENRFDIGTGIFLR
jgi:hypothetical protein